jgi:hypothetical protein
MSKVDNNKDRRIEITEMWLAEADDKCFYGIIKRSTNAKGQPHLFSRININDGNVQACASEQQELSKILDELCLMYLNGLHTTFLYKIFIFNSYVFLN